MAKGFKHGAGGAGLNFNVVCNPQPANPRENTIWVDTDRINNYYFSAEQPENMAEYDVWITTGASSTVAFNALKKNGIQVSPLFAKQYISGAWVDVTAKSYQGNKWVELWNGDIYVNGVFKVSFNARAVGRGDFANIAAPTATDNGTHVIIKPTDTGAQNDGIWQSEKIRISKSNTILQVKFVGGSQNENWAFYGISKTEPVTGNLNPVVQKTPTNFNTTETMDITALEGDYYLWFHVAQQSGSSYAYFDISEIRIL